MPVARSRAASRSPVTRLSVNVNKVALLRNSRTLGIPDVAHVARIALDAGAHGITVHPRPDERHIRRADVTVLRDLVAGYEGREFNIEGNPFHGLLELAKAAHPHQCTLVPDAVEAFTSDHGWDLAEHAEKLAPIIEELHGLDIRVSLFMDPVPAQIQRARDLGADRVELYTESYARAFGTSGETKMLASFAAAADAASKSGLGINAGHDLNQANLPVFLKAVHNVSEVSIGHALIADALETGMAEAVRAYLGAITSVGPS
jgi:pyridoxine 5-phosphate synthase